MPVSHNSFSRLLVDEDRGDGVLSIRLHRPEARNAIDAAMVDELRAVLDTRSPRAVVLGSADPACFCAGADLRLPDRERADVSDRLYELYGAMVRLPAPIVAVVEGPAIGGGAQLAIAADLRVAGTAARFRFAGPGHGLAVAAWGLPSLVGRGRAMDLCLTMRAVGADEAFDIGLVDRIEEDPFAVALRLAAAIARLDAGAVRRVKDIVHRASASLDALERERGGNGRTWDGSMTGLDG